MPSMSGLILVFDMDGVIGPEDGFKQGRRPVINPVILNLLRKAHTARLRGDVAAIFLLTKNTSGGYVGIIDSALRSRIGRASGISAYEFFDDALYSEKFYTTSRGYPQYYTKPQKSIADIEHMIDIV